MKSIFEQYPNHFKKGYDLLLEDSFLKEFWDGGQYKNQRINWKNAYKAKKELPEFQKSGIYIWGYDKTPIYLGKAENQSLASRFNRYAFGKRCQCVFAEKYSKMLDNGSEIITTKKLREELNIQSKARALGSKTFGEIGADKIWFILIPIKKELITKLEIELIDIAEKWNLSKGFSDLINLERIKKQKKKEISKRNIKDN